MSENPNPAKHESTPKNNRFLRVAGSILGIFGVSVMAMPGQTEAHPVADTTKITIEAAKPVSEVKAVVSDQAVAETPNANVGPNVKYAIEKETVVASQESLSNNFFDVSKRIADQEVFGQSSSTEPDEKGRITITTLHNNKQGDRVVTTRELPNANAGDEETTGFSITIQHAGSDGSFRTVSSYSVDRTGEGFVATAMQGEEQLTGSFADQGATDASFDTMRADLVAARNGNF